MSARVIALFFLSLMLISPIAAAVPPGYEIPSSLTEKTVEKIEAVNEDTYTVITFQASDDSIPSSSGTGSVCQVSQLTPEEVQRLKDSILVPGLIGNEITAGTPPNSDREKVSDQNKLLIPNPTDSETAFQKDVPIDILHPQELAPLQNQNVRGPFAFGVSLSDSLRAAQCGVTQSCAVYGEQLQYRNSGEGITGSVKDMYNSIVADLDKPDSQFTEEEADYIQAQIQGEQILENPDANKIEAEVFTRTKNPILMNHIAADNTWNAGILTNCDNGNCVLTLYSMFDKYFNSWFSGELVVSTFGPTMWGQFKKMLTRGKRSSLIPADLAKKIDPRALWNSARIDTTEVLARSEPLRPSEFSKRLGGAIKGADVIENAKKSLLKETSSYQAMDQLLRDRKIFGAGSGAGFIEDAFGPEGALTKITNLEERQKISAFIGKYLKPYADNTTAVREFYLDGGEAVLKKNPVTAARALGGMAFDFDDTLKSDFVELIRREPSMGFSGKGVKPFTGGTGIGEPQNLISGDSKFWRDNILETFVKKGEFSDGAKGTINTLELSIDPVTGVKGVQIYKLSPRLPKGTLQSVEGLDKGLYEGLNVQLSSGITVPINKDHLEIIRNDLIEHPEVAHTVFTADWEKDFVLTPQELSRRLLLGDDKGGILGGKIKTFSRNVNSLNDEAIARDWYKSGYTNLLSKSLQTQDKFLKNYFNVLNPNVAESGIGWTVKMYGYWWLTRGAGLDQISVYQLPKEWTQVEFVPGEGEFYQDAYIDFFSNEGSDTGDIFQRVISKFPIPVILGEFAQNYPTLDKAWNFINGTQGRSAPDNLAMYAFGAPSCPDCTTTLASPEPGRFDVSYQSTESLNSFFLEHAKSEEAKERGQYLLTFAHKADVKGQMKGEVLDEINLLRAQQDKTTCTDVMNDLFIYGAASRLVGAERIGAVMALSENLVYLTGGMMGTLVTVANQLAYAPQMQDCIDDKEGYFASLFVPVQQEKKGNEGKADELQKSVSDNAIDGIRDFANTVKTEHADPSLPDKVIQEATSKVQELVDNAQKNNVAEAQLRVEGSSSGYLKSQEVMYFWVGGGSFITPTQYPTQGKTVLIDQNGHTTTLDNATGTLSVDGQIIIEPEQADHVRLATKDLAIPAIEIPQRLNTFTLPADANRWLLTVNVRGETIVQDPELLDCIQSATLEQSAVPLNSNNMSEAFGPAQTIVTDAYPNIAIDSTKNRILLGGQAPQVASGPSAAVNVYGDRRVVVTGAPNPPAGNFQSMLLENGSILYKPATNELIIWLRHHAQAVVKESDVKNLIGDLTTTKNTLTSCDEPAVDLRVETDTSTPGTKLNGDNLTAGLKKNGPFQVFDTDSRQYIFYSRLIDGACQPYFKVLNKATGQVYDQPITSISQAEDGTITIKTGDGQTHTLKFSSQNGKPILTYDGNSELLRSAIGQGGSFYYDPNKGVYVAENAQLLPLNDNFKNQGIAFQANPDGSVSGKASDNVFVINPSQGGQGLFNIPSLPENLALAGVMVLVLGMICAGIYLDSRRKNTPIHETNRN